jgi:hypothetical protein
VLVGVHRRVVRGLVAGSDAELLQLSGVRKRRSPRLYIFLVVAVCCDLPVSSSCYVGGLQVRETAGFLVSAVIVAATVFVF